MKREKKACIENKGGLQMKGFKRILGRMAIVGYVLIGGLRTLVGIALGIASVLWPVLIFMDMLGQCTANQSFLMIIYILIKALMISGTLFIVGMLLTNFILPNMVKELISEEIMY